MTLRWVEVRLPCQDPAALEGWEPTVPVIDLWRRPEGDHLVSVCAILHAENTDPFLEELQEHFGAPEGFRVVVQTVEATLPRPPELEKQAEDLPDAKASSVAKPAKKGASISREELLNDLAPGTRITKVSIAMVLLSGIVAAVGLVRGDVAVIIGAMVIAPLLTPNMALALAVTLGDLALAKKALRTLVVGGAIALGLSLLIGAGLLVDPNAPEILARTHPRVDDGLVALASGVAGALAFTTGVPASLVGVMVAVSLLPPLVAAGLLLGGGHGVLGVHAGTLFALNVVCVNLAAVLTFLWQGIRPLTWWEKDKARRYSRIAVSLWGLLLLLLTVLLVVVWRG